MTDSISRQAAIKSVCTMLKNCFNATDEMLESVKITVGEMPDVPDTNVGDMISRQAALNSPVKMVSDGLEWVPVYHIKELPSAQPGWIPWDSGKFPEESGTYTVTAYDGATKRVTYAKYQKRLKRWELTGARAYWRVLAWMEKPEPWEGGQG